MSRKEYTTPIIVAFVISIFIFVFFNSEKTIENALLTFGISLLYTVVIGVGNAYVNNLLSRNYSWVEHTRMRSILGILATIVVNVILVFLCNYIYLVIIENNPVREFFSNEFTFYHWITINIAILVSAILHAKSFIEEWKKSAKKEVLQQKIIAKSANAQFESLKNQLDPHFLFNSLNVLSSLIDENPELAQKFTSSMSKIYRYILDEKDKELVTVDEEVEFAKTYCELLKTRFEDSVQFEFKIAEDEKRNFVVPLSLQLLLENAIKHNYASDLKPLHIIIFSEDNFLVIQNNMQKREMVNDREGIGLSNIAQRYSLLTDRNVTIEENEEIFKVKIPVLSEKISVMETNKTSDKIAYENAAKQVEEIKSFYLGLISYCIVIPVLFFINWNSSSKNWWAFWPMFFWGIGLIFHAVKAFGISSNWEEKQIQKLMEKEEQTAKSNMWK